MDLKAARKIAETYGFVIAETENEKAEFERLGYTRVAFDIEKLLPELRDQEVRRSGYAHIHAELPPPKQI